MIRLLTGAALAATISWPIAVAVAQTGPAQQGLGGPEIPGVCLLSREAIFASAAIGKAATVRLKQIADEAQAEVDAERKPIDAEIQAFQTEAPKLNAEQRRMREQALTAKLQPLQAKAEQRSREVEATRAKALERISVEAQPVIAQVYRQKSCGLLVDRNSVLGGNMTNDLTAGVVQALDVKISTISFNRETLPVQTAAASVAR